MSDISIPGVSSRFNTESLVDDLLAAEGIRLTRLQTQLEEYQTEQRVWREINTGLGNLRNSTRDLFSFENPFNERNAISSNESVLRAVANRTAAEGVTTIKVIQTAQADRFVSQDLPADLKVEQGVYRFTVGEEALTLRFRGGGLREFSDALNRRNPELLRTSVVKNRADSQVILIESLKEGGAHGLGFAEDAVELAKGLGWVEERALPFSGVDVAGSSSGVGGEFVLAPGEERLISLVDPVDDTAGLVLRYEQRLRAGEVPAPPALPPGPSAPDLGSVSLRGVTLPNLPSAFTALSPGVPEPVPIVEESSLVFARNGTQSTALPDVQDSEDFISVQVQLSSYTSGIDGLEIKNPNTIKELTIRNIEIIDPDARGNLVPKNAANSNRNALLEVEGILVERESNSIDDIIPGVTLDLRRESDEEIELQIEPDLDLVKESLIEWVGWYNQVIRDVNILTRNNPEIIDEIEYFTDEERETYTERLGLFQGDSTLNTLRQRLQNLTSSSYETRDGRELALLSQLGISTNASRGGAGQGVNFTNLRGYLEVNEEILDQSLERHFLAVKDLFGRDSDDDLLVDQGVGYQIDQFVQSFVGIGGIVTNRSSGYDSLISNTNDDIRDYEEHLEDYEAEVRRDFATMEAAINSLENSSQGLQNLNPSNNRNNN